MSEELSVETRAQLQALEQMDTWFRKFICDEDGGWNTDSAERVMLKLEELHHPVTTAPNTLTVEMYYYTVEIGFHFLRRYPDTRAATQFYHRVCADFNDAEMCSLHRIRTHGHAELALNKLVRERWAQARALFRHLSVNEGVMLT